MSRNPNPQPAAARLHLLSALHRPSPSRRHPIPQSGHSELRTAHCELRTENCDLKTANFEPRTVNREERTENRELKTENCDLNAVAFELRTANCELKTVNCELPTNFARRAVYTAKTSSEALKLFFIFTLYGCITNKSLILINLISYSHTATASEFLYPCMAVSLYAALPPNLNCTPLSIPAASGVPERRVASRSA